MFIDLKLFYKSSLLKILILVVGIVALFSFFSGNVLADNSQNTAQEPIIVHFFEDRLCPVCRDQKEFMNEIADNYPHMQLYVHSISDTDKLRELADKYEIEDYVIMAPTTFVGPQLLQFNDFTPRQEAMLIAALEGETTKDVETLFVIPLLGIEFSISDWSLPIISLVLGILDGFNVCSLGALILILSIVMKFNSRKKIFLYGGVFILATTVIYGTLVFVWGRLFETFLGQLEILRYIVGFAALAGGIVFFRDFVKFARYGPACESGNPGIKQGATSRVIKAFKDPKTSTIFMISSLVIFAGVITIVELPCSIGLPLTFTGILAQHSLSLLEYTTYILIYLFFYMLDEFIVFTGAVMTRHIWFAGSKFITIFTFIGSMVLFYFAFYYLIGF